jgi:hypothetical protein
MCSLIFCEREKKGSRMNHLRRRFTVGGADSSWIKEDPTPSPRIWRIDRFPVDRAMRIIAEQGEVA